jgi:hypothetical protein
MLGQQCEGGDQLTSFGSASEKQTYGARPTVGGGLMGIAVKGGGLVGYGWADRLGSGESPLGDDVEFTHTGDPLSA